MKKLFDKVGGKRSKDKENPLVGKLVMVGQHSVRVEAILGEGGFSTVYRTTSTKEGSSMGQPFALKHIRLAADTDAIKEVQQEVRQSDVGTMLSWVFFGRSNGRMGAWPWQSDRAVAPGFPAVEKMLGGRACGHANPAHPPCIGHDPCMHSPCA